MRFEGALPVRAFASYRGQRNLPGLWWSATARPAVRRRARGWGKFEATGTVCNQVGWEFRLLGAPDAVLVRNVRWLVGYRPPRHRLEPVAFHLLAAFAEPAALMDGALAVGRS
ncbi:hypothetical protein [Streptomyces chrestomyceticus]|uniref:hypothetical protein n=1 Tax=Streptomyces chrestomyceticus TaxID=68185 RepID=UPI0033F84F9F